jgi:hypothetical protein
VLLLPKPNVQCDHMMRCGNDIALTSDRSQIQESESSKVLSSGNCFVCVHEMDPVGARELFRRE